MERDYVNVERFGKFGNILIVRVNGSLALNPSDRDDLPIEFELGAGCVGIGPWIAG